MELMPHQEFGAKWLASRRYALLADEMRVGKTPQVIAAADMLNVQNILVICPATARANWAAEYQDWSVIGLPTRPMYTAEHVPLSNGITICSYNLTSRPSVWESLRQVPWDLIVPDESHYLKSADALRTNLVYGNTGLIHNTKRLWALSGTPAPNHPGELWVMLHVFGVYPGKYESFVRRFCTGYWNGYEFKITGGKNLAELRKLMDPMMLRRKMKEVRPEYPDIDYSLVRVDPGDIVREFYRPEGTAEEQHIMEQIVQGASCDDDLLAGLKACENQLATLNRYTGLAKVQNFADMLTEDLIGGNHKAVVFAIHREVIKSLAKRLEVFNPIVINGSVPAIKRQPLIDKFNNDPKHRVFIGNIQAAKENISLASASDVWFLEASWVPGDNIQAASRCGLLDKAEPTFARFVTLTGSIDELIQSVNQRKAKTLSQLF